MIDRLAAADFDPFVGATFPAEHPAGAVALELIEVKRLREPPARPGRPPTRAPFSLLFRTRTAGHLAQGIVALTHDRLGRLDVFMVPVGRDPDGLLLEAVFN